MDEDLKRVMRFAASPYAPETRARMAELICGQEARYVSNDMLYAIRKRYGFRGLALAELILFGWCFLLLAVIDFVPLLKPEWRCVLGLAACSAAFCFNGDEIHRAMWKLAFLLTSVLWCRYWLSAGFVLLLSAHVPSHSSGREGQRKW